MFAAAMAGATNKTIVRSFNTWIDPDGNNNGQNQVQQIGIGTNTVPSADRLEINLPNAVNGTVLVPGRLTIVGTGTTGGDLVAELSTDGGSSYPNTAVITSGDGSGTGSFSNIVAAAGQCVIRYVTTATQGEDLSTTTATSFAYLTTWNTDNYSVVYDSV